MAAAPDGFAPLTAAMIRRASLAAEPPAAAEQVAPSARGWRDDLRLFAVTWAAGFVFFLVFLA